VAVSFFCLWPAAGELEARPAFTKQQSLDEWRSLTAPTAAPPRVFVKGDTIRFYFQTETNSVGFIAHWSRVRAPTKGYHVDVAQLRFDESLTEPNRVHGWQEASVIAGAEWRRLTTNLIEALAPRNRECGIYYQGFLADRLLYRDSNGEILAVPIGQQPRDIKIERRYSLEETLQILASLIERQLEESHPRGTLFMLVAPNASRFPQPLLLDRKRRRCVWLSPAVLFQGTERGLDLSVTTQGLRAMTYESHGIALLKNPVSSVFRLADVLVQSVVRFARIPPLKPGFKVPPLTHTNGMDLASWEQWLDHYTGTRQEQGSLELLINGEKFFPRLRQAMAEATNHIRMEVYIFDQDDVAVGVADQLKERSGQVKVQVILDQLGSIAAGAKPPSTPLPENFVPPSSIVWYLRHNSRVEVRPFLNPWFTSDHSKVFLVDGARAWLGGMNIGREYRHEWHDLMVEIEGPVVGSLEGEFRRDWAHAGIFGDAAYLSALVTTPKRSEAAPLTNHWMKVRLLPTRTAWKPFSAAVQGAIHKSRGYIYVENPYLFDKRVIVALVQARNRGVDVRVVLPRANDFDTGRRSNLVTANYLLQHGVRVYFYPGMTHVKALLADGWACLGSANLNHLSLRFCHEDNIATSDPAFAERLKTDLFEEDFSRSFEMKSPISVDWVDFMADFVIEGF
jgi:phosphatidylserine/phosphatidylglycerophosphate/cardiolipin synthase-like enzyme